MRVSKRILRYASDFQGKTMLLDMEHLLLKRPITGCKQVSKTKKHLNEISCYSVAGSHMHKNVGDGRDKASIFYEKLWKKIPRPYVNFRKAKKQLRQFQTMQACTIPQPH